MLTILAIIQVQHQIRHTETRYYLALQDTIKAKEEWGRLMLEKTHLSAPARIEHIAHTKLKMTLNMNQDNGNLQTLYIPKPLEQAEP